jgi:hypothetical protein
MSFDSPPFVVSSIWNWLRIALLAVVGLGGVMAGVLLGAAAFAFLSVRAPAVPADPRGFQEMIERRPVLSEQADATAPVVAGRTSGIGGASSDSGMRAAHSPSSSSDPAAFGVPSGPMFLDRTAAAASTSLSSG